MKNKLPDNLFPENIKNLLHAMSDVGFFERSVLIGSWVMLIYQELYGARYVYALSMLILPLILLTQKVN